MYNHLLHADTFIHRPFNFATVNNRKTRDRICQVEWEILAKFGHLFQNPIPCFDVPTYSVHVDNGIHLHVHNKSHIEMLLTQQISLPDDGQCLFN